MRRRDRLRLRAVDGAVDARSRRAPSRPRRRRRSAARGRRTPRAAPMRTPRRSRACARSPLAPFASRITVSFVEQSPSTVIALNVSSTAGREARRLARLERVVGRDDREHRREVGVDHPGALRHPADGEAVARRERLLRLRVGGHDRVRRLVPAVVGERGDGSVDARQQPVHRQLHADHAGREHEHLLGRDAEQRGRMRGRGDRVRVAGRAGRGVRDARVDDDRLRIGGGELRCGSPAGTRPAPCCG